MGFYLAIIAIPSILLITFCKFFFNHKINWKEWLAQFGILAVTTSLCMGLLWAGAMTMSGDFSIWNGYVTEKVRDEVTCSHEHQCGETCSNVSSTDSKGKTTTRRVCSPKYCKDHAYDVDWDVRTTLGRWTIDRVDRRGLEEPQRWSEVEVGDPVAESRYAKNYLLIDPNRFVTDPAIFAKYAGTLPDYPKPYDYYRYYRVLDDSKRDNDGINIWLNEQLRKDGAAKELNVILVVTKNDPDYYYALMQYWRGARKNEVILFYGVDDEDKVQWVKAISFADGQNNQIMLKELETMTYEQTFTDQLVQQQYKLIVEKFNRIPNAEFAFMAEAYAPPVWWVIVLVLLNLCGTAGISYVFIKEDVL